MSFLVYLWLPILLSTVFVFILSGILHMALPWHKSDYKTVPNEDKVREALRPFDVPPGDYMMPSCAGGDYNSPDFKAKLDAGPNWVMTVLPKGQSGMGITFLQWFIFLLLVSAFIAYIAVHALPGDAPVRMVFRCISAIGFLAYATAQWPQSIWMRRSWSTTVKCTIDAILYGLATGATFAWLWPE